MIYLYNTQTKRKELFFPLSDIVKIYTCGPTVYNYAHVGNLRSYIFPDILKSILKYYGHKVQHIINFTDVGHLTSDDDTGDDKVEEASKGKNAFEVTEYFADAFKQDLLDLNIDFPNKFTPATHYIQQQIDLIKQLEQNGKTYITVEGVYFDTSNYPYTRLIEKTNSNINRVSTAYKKNDSDFALWKFSLPNEKRQMEWDSPWGKGYPGWHVECTAMIFAELGKTIDIHTGGIDHIPVHHSCEIAQAEGVTGQPFVKYWLHGAFLNFNGNKISKSSGDFTRLKDIDPMVFKYLCLNSHYRSELEFSDESIKTATTSYRKLKNLIQTFPNPVNALPNEVIVNALSDDLNTSKALACFWSLLKSKDYSNQEKANFVQFVDSFFKLNLLEKEEAPLYIKEIAFRRLLARQQNNWEESDKLRCELLKLGWKVKDRKGDYELYRD